MVQVVKEHRRCSYAMVRGTVLPAPTHRVLSMSNLCQTLMDVLAGRKTGGVISGEVHVNGECGRQPLHAQELQACTASLLMLLFFRAGGLQSAFRHALHCHFGCTSAPAIAADPGWCPVHPPSAGFPKNQATFARVMGYCEQEDVHLPQVGAGQGRVLAGAQQTCAATFGWRVVRWIGPATCCVELPLLIGDPLPAAVCSSPVQATVSEALHFSATLRLPSTVDKQTRTNFVEEVGGPWLRLRVRLDGGACVTLIGP